MAIMSTPALKAMDWFEYRCQCPSHSCTNRAIFAVVAGRSK